MLLASVVLRACLLWAVCGLRPALGAVEPRPLADKPPLTTLPAQDRTTQHEPGRCAMRGQCGKQSFFGGELPCPDNSPASAPNVVTREKLVAICGADWEEERVKKVCCDEVQVDALRSNLKRAESIIASCPACKANFFDLFCTFTCSPDQSTFVNVTALGKSTSGTEVVTEVDNLWSNEFGQDFYDSCKDVKFGATGGKAMDFIGGGAKNFTAFLKFLGDKKPFGSPFQINFPRPKEDQVPSKDDMDYNSPDAIPCNSTDEAFRCSCVDCSATCPQLAPVPAAESCHVGALPCLSFAVIMVYSIALSVVVLSLLGRAAYIRRRMHQKQRLQWLADTSLSDDEDEDETFLNNARFLEPPQRPYRLNNAWSSVFHQLGKYCSRYPLITISLSFLFVIVLSLGWLNFHVETNPERLWVSEDSAAAREKHFFDENFGPFHRAEQAFLVNDTMTTGLAPVLSYDTLLWWFDVETRVQRMLSPEQHVPLGEICFNPTGEACVIQSISGYFGGPSSGLRPDGWEEQLQHCTEQPGSQECLPEFQQPLSKDMVLGGMQGENALSARALIVTWVVNNHERGSPEERTAIDWEEGLRSIMQMTQREAKERGLRLSFTTEMSIESELNQSSNTDAKIVVISYVIMFIYASLALGLTTLSARSIMQNPAIALVQSKFSLGIIGILTVLMSVSASVGLFSACGVTVTLIIAEVIPFLVLAIGVDNIFLIVHEFERINVSLPDDSIEARIAQALGRMGPSILLSTLTEFVAFALGAAVSMPAVRNFAIYAAGAVVINALLQSTMFISFLALNQRRVEDSRADCFPLLQVKSAAPRRSLDTGAYGYDDEGVLHVFIRKVYAPRLLKPKSKTVVVTLFLALFAVGLAFLPTVTLGFDQRIAFPDHSYLVDYFNDLDKYFNTGIPVYFVVRGANTSQRLHQQELCGRFSSCHTYSLTNVLEQEAKRPNVSFMTGSTASWIDDFFTWLNPSNEACCVEDDGSTCFKGREPPWNVTLYGMPEGEEFVRYLHKWVHSETNEDCPFGGKAPYSSALVIEPSAEIPVPASHFRTAHIPLRSQADFIKAYASARRVASAISQDQQIDVFPYSKFYIFFDQYASIVQLSGILLGSGLAFVLVLTSLMLGSVQTGLVVTLTVGMILVDVLGVMAMANVSLNAISLVNLVISLGIAVEFCAHVARAFMFPSRSTITKFGPTLLSTFAVSSYPINSDSPTIENDAIGGNGKQHGSFLSSHSGLMPSGGDGGVGKTLRAATALVNVAPSVFTGIFLTKILGVAVLAFTRSKIFEIYYFRIWLALVLLGGAHALIWLPVALSLCGGGGKAGWIDTGGGDVGRLRLGGGRLSGSHGQTLGRGGLEEDLASRSYRGSRALLIGDYEDDSEADEDDEADDTGDIIVRNESDVISGSSTPRRAQAHALAQKPSGRVLPRYRDLVDTEEDDDEGNAIDEQPDDVLK